MKNSYIIKLKEQEQEAIKSQDLEKLFVIFEIYKNTNQNKFANNILIQIIDIAFGILNKKIENSKQISFKDDIYLVRAIYKQAIFLWKNRKFDDCVSIFVMLYRLVDDKKFKNSIVSCLAGVSNNIDFDTFYDLYVNQAEDNLNRQDNYRYFIMDFNKNIDEFLNKKLFEIDNIIGSIK